MYIIWFKILEIVKQSEAITLTTPVKKDEERKMIKLNKQVEKL